MREIQLTQGMVALVDDADFEELSEHKWYAEKRRNTYYAKRNTPPTTTYMHIDIMRAKGIDHKDGDGLNNQRENLRPATKASNSHNVGLTLRNTSGYKGIFLCRGKWKAQIKVNGKAMHLGTFSTKEAAAQAYNDAASKYHGEFARLNVISSTP